MRAEQAWYSYEAGHGLQAASVPLLPQERAILDDLTDLAGYLSPGQQFDHYDMGYPCGRYYVFSRTWPDGENARPGTVQTHCLLFNPSDVKQLSDPLAIEPIFFTRSLATRSVAAGSVAIDLSKREEAVVPRSVALGLLAKWFGSGTRPVVLEEDPTQCVSWLWRRLAPWQRPKIAFCTFTVRPRHLRDQPFDLLGVAPGSSHAFQSIVTPSLPRRELDELEQLVDSETATKLWRLAEEQEVAGVSPQLWIRFRRLDDTASDSTAAALGALDLLPSIIGDRDCAQALRARTTDRVLRPLEVTAARELPTVEIANLAVRDLDRLVVGANDRVNSLIAEHLRSRLPTLTPEELPSFKSLVLASVRGRRDEHVAVPLEESLRTGSGSALWELAWSTVPEVAWKVWCSLHNRRREEVGPILSMLSTEAVDGMLPHLFDDDDLWVWLEGREEVTTHVTRELDRVMASQADWPSSRPLRLPAQSLAEKFLTTEAVRPVLATLVALALLDEPAVLPEEVDEIPKWMVSVWAAEADAGALHQVLDGRPRLFPALAIALSNDSEETHFDRWEVLLASATDQAILVAPSPEALPNTGEARFRWARRIAPALVTKYAEGSINVDACAAWVPFALEDRQTAEAVQRAADGNVAAAFALLRHPRCLWLRRRPEVVGHIMTKWLSLDQQRRSPDVAVVLALLTDLERESSPSFEAGSTAILAGILRQPDPALANLAGLTFPVLHDRLCQGRKDSWLGQLKHWWGGDWDRAGRLRERYAAAWLQAQWSLPNLWEASGENERIFEQLVREVVALRNGKASLAQSDEGLPKRARKILKDAL